MTENNISHNEHMQVTMKSGKIVAVTCSCGCMRIRLGHQLATIYNESEPYLPLAIITCPNCGSMYFFQKCKTEKFNGTVVMKGRILNRVG